MHIVCPHCTTSYAIDLATLGASGRTVRCSRCKEVWLARPEDAVEIAAPVPALADGRRLADDAAAEWERMARRGRRRRQASRGRQPLDFGRLAGRRQADSRPTGRRSPETRRGPAAPGGPHALLFAAARSGCQAPDRQVLSQACRPVLAGRAVRQPADRLRRDGRAGAGAGDLARRRGAAAAADRDVLQDGRARRESARADRSRTSRSRTRPWTASRCW